MNDTHKRYIWLYHIAIAILAALFFIPYLGGVNLFDWDEINFAESAREMLISKDYLTVQINFVPFWEKPPLFIWMQVLSMKAFGVNEFAARFPNAICGIISLLVLFNFGRKVVDVRFGLIWTLLYGGSILPFFYFKSGIIDPWFNLFIFMGIYFIYLYFNQEDKRMLHASESALFIGLAILTKGPVALLVFILTTGVFLLIKKFRVQLNLKEIGVFLLVLTFTGGFWFILQIIKGNFDVIADFIVYQIRLFRTKDAGHGGFLFYHFVVLLVGVFPASIIALPTLFGIKQDKKKDSGSFAVWMLILFWVVLILFTIVKTKIVHYSSLCYFPLTFLAAWSVFHQTYHSATWKKITPALVITFGTLLSLIVFCLTFIDHYKEYIIRQRWIRDQFAVACLGANGGWKGYEFIVGLVLLFGIVLFLVFWKKDQTNKAITLLAGTIPFFMFISMLLIVPRVEAYSQRTAIEFFSSVSNEDAYLGTMGYKSYAHLFYGQVKNHSHELSGDKQWLLTGDIDKPAYFAVKITQKGNFMIEYPMVEYLYEKNGFVFFKRTPK